MIFRLCFYVLEMLDELRVFYCAIRNLIFELLIELVDAPDGTPVCAA